MDYNINILQSVHEEIERKVNEQLVLVLQSKGNPEDILNTKNLQKLEANICNQHNALQNPPQDHRQIPLSVDFEDYDTISQNLNKNTQVQIENLDKLLSFYFLDTKRKSWLILAKKLQQCLLSENCDVYRKSLKIHYRIMTIPSIMGNSYLNLLESLILIFNNDPKGTMHQRTVSILKMLLAAQSPLLKNLHLTKSRLMEEIIITFIYMLHSHKPRAIQTLSSLDYNASWLRKFCYGVHTRKIIMSCLKKTPNLIYYFLHGFISHIQGNSEKSDFVHSAHFLIQLLKFKRNLLILPFKVHNKSITTEYFVLLMLHSLNTEIPHRTIVGHVLLSVLTNHIELLQHADITTNLFKPFLLENRSIHIYDVIDDNRHILDVLNSVSKLPRTGLNKAGKTNPDIPQIIVNVTIAAIRTFINESEFQYFINNGIFELLDCCVNLFTVHSREVNHANTTKLVAILHDFYESGLNHNFTSNYYAVRIANVICFFITYDPNALKTLAGHRTFLQEIVSVVLTNVDYTGHSFYCNLILHLALSKTGRSVIQNSYRAVIKLFLCNIRVAGEDSGVCNKFLHVLTLINNNFQTVKALLSYENEETSLDCQRMETLWQLLENCLNGELEFDLEVLGLQCIQIFIRNLDTLLYLQHNCKLQERLMELQVKSQLRHTDKIDTGAIIIDECSSLCQYLLLSIKHVGAVDIKLSDIKQQQTTIPHHSCFIQSRSNSAIQKFLHDYRNNIHDHNWISQARKFFRVSCREKYKTSVIVDLLDQVPKLNPLNLAWPSFNVALFPEDCYGVTLIVRFGLQNNLLHSSQQNDENLMLLLKQSRTFLGFRPEEFVGFDWFVAVMFLICSGKLEKCKTVLMNVFQLPIATLIWPFVCYTSNQKQKFADSFYWQLEVILEDATRISHALKGVDISASHIARSWLSQCFFGILDFKEVCNFIAVAVLYPPEYMIFYFVTVFEHLKDDIFTTFQSLNAFEDLKISQIMNFKIVDYFDFMDKLYKQYKNCLQI